MMTVRPPSVGLIARVLLATVILPGSVLVWIPWFLIVGGDRFLAHWPPAIGDAPALVLIVIGSSMYLASAWRFATEGQGTPAPWDAPRKIVVGGLYRWTRNPMYVGVVLALFGEAWLLPSGAMLVYALAMAVAFHLRVVVYEEPAMQRLSIADYDAYVGRVKRWGLF